MFGRYNVQIREEFEKVKVAFNEANERLKEANIYIDAKYRSGRKTLNKKTGELKLTPVSESDSKAYTNLITKAKVNLTTKLRVIADELEK